MKPNTRLSKDDSDSDCHKRYRGIVGSLGYLVTMTRPDLAWSYSELSKYVQFPGKADRSPFTGGGNQTHVAVPKDLLTTEA